MQERLFQKDMPHDNKTDLSFYNNVQGLVWSIITIAGDSKPLVADCHGTSAGDGAGVARLDDLQRRLVVDGIQDKLGHRKDNAESVRDLIPTD